MVPRSCAHNAAPARRTGRYNTCAFSRATASRSGPAVPPYTVRKSTTPSSTGCDNYDYDDNFDGRVRPTIHNARRELPASAPGRCPHTLRRGPSSRAWLLPPNPSHDDMHFRVPRRLSVRSIVFFLCRFRFYVYPLCHHMSPLLPRPCRPCACQRRLHHLRGLLHNTPVRLRVRLQIPCDLSG